MSKKVLIITYYWPPAGGPGVQRWLKFVKYLPEFNVEPIVYCPSNPNYPIIDDSLTDEVSTDLTIIKHPIKEPYAFARLFSKSSTKKFSTGVFKSNKKQSFIDRLLLYIRGNYFIPDARKQWIAPSVKFLSDYIQEHNIETIITTGPPHSMHLIGLQLKQKFNIKWITDFRDPWTTIGYHKQLKLTHRSRVKHLQLESKVLNGADQIVVTSSHTKSEFSSKTNQPIEVITNGYDRHDITIDEKDEQFSISHVGSLLLERNPLILWESISELINEHSDFAKHIELNFIGVVSDGVLQSIYKYGLKPYTNTIGYVSHDEAIKMQLSSQVLLLIEIDSEDTKAIIPGKLFEYMVSETPILAIGPKDSDVESIIKQTNTGTYYTYEDKNAIKSQILTYFEAYKTRSLRSHAIGLEPYSRRALTKRLSELL
ncbi:MAG: glycosyltransferase [Bacteroidota bacterium]